MQFPGMPQMQFAPGVSLVDRLKQFGTAAQPIAKAAGTAMTTPPTAGAPMDISPAATNAGTNVPAAGGMPMTGIMGLLQGMKPQGILSLLQQMSAGGQQPQGLPGSAALGGAGMLTPTIPPPPGDMDAAARRTAAFAALGRE